MSIKRVCVQENEDGIGKILGFSRQAKRMEIYSENMNTFFLLLLFFETGFFL